MYYICSAEVAHWAELILTTPEDGCTQFEDSNMFDLVSLAVVSHADIHCKLTSSLCTRHLVSLLFPVYNNKTANYNSATATQGKQ